MSLKARLERLEQRYLPPPQPDPESTPALEDWLEEVSPSYDWSWRHLVHIREHLDLVTTGQLRKLMVFCPPRHGKSELVTVRYPAWTLERWPHKHIVVAGYNQLLADRFSRKVRRIVGDRIRLNNERTSVSDWETFAGGGGRRGRWRHRSRC